MSVNWRKVENPDRWVDFERAWIFFDGKSLAAKERVSILLADDAIEQLCSGVDLTDGRTRPAEVGRLRDSAKYTHLEIRITEGQNRQVRRMIESVEEPFHRAHYD